MRLEREEGLSAASRQHVAVMAEEVVGLVRAAKPMMIVDATVGTGGHAERMLEETGAHLLGIDRDAAALRAAAARLARFNRRLTLRQADFSELPALLDQCGTPCVGAIVADLGMSSFALDDAERGFSFRLDGPLDMRMDQRQSLRAYDLINEEAEDELARLLRDYGEEQRARRIARAIVQARRRRPIETTAELSGVIQSAIGGRRAGSLNPATRTFQALRIAVNHELESLRELLVKAPTRLKVGGRLLILAYHSLEDRPVKQCFRELTRSAQFAALTRKALRPSPQEVSANPRARSARLRAVERVAS